MLGSMAMQSPMSPAMANVRSEFPVTVTGVDMAFTWSMKGSGGTASTGSNACLASIRALRAFSSPANAAGVMVRVRLGFVI
jgi:hypothetical protein